MRKLPVLLIVILAITLGCGGGKKTSKSAQAGQSSDNQGGNSSDFATTDDGKPGWLNRGSVALTKDDGSRVFYGVGMASGIKNPALLRDTAGNRARNEMAKVFEVFSASLMKDYMASTGEQNIENATKTVTSMSLKGVEIVDRYIDADGSLYALASLDLNKSVKAIQEAEAQGLVKGDVQKVNVDDIFDKHAKKEAPPPPPAAVAGASGGETKTSSGTSVQVQSGGKPEWVNGEDPRYTRQQFLCGVGFGDERSIAENGGLAAISRIFISRVQSVSQDFMGAYSKTGAQSLEVQSTETLTKVSTDKVISGVEIKEVWKGGGTTYALACLERAKVSRILHEQISEADTRTERYLQKAKSADKAGRVRELSQAMDALVEREVLNGELRIVNADGVGESGPYSHADVAAALEAAFEALKVGVMVKGPYDDDFRGAFIEALTKRGYQVSDLSEGENIELDVLVDAKIRVEDGGAGTGSAKKLYFARAVVLAEVKNVAAGKVIATIDEKKKEGHRNKEEAERKAVRKLAKKITFKVGAKIDNAMTGR